MNFEEELKSMIEDTKKKRDNLLDEDYKNGNEISYVVLERELAVLIVVLIKYQKSIMNSPKF